MSETRGSWWEWVEYRLAMGRGLPGYEPVIRSIPEKKSRYVEKCQRLADVVQWLEYRLAMAGIAGSSPVIRSISDRRYADTIGKACLAMERGLSGYEPVIRSILLTMESSYSARLALPWNGDSRVTSPSSAPSLLTMESRDIDTEKIL